MMMTGVFEIVIKNNMRKLVKKMIDLGYAKEGISYDKLIDDVVNGR